MANLLVNRGRKPFSGSALEKNFQPAMLQEQIMAGEERYALNVRGLLSPLVHLKVIQRVHELEPGDRLTLEHIDPESVNDLMAILKHYPLDLGELQEQDGSFVLQLTKTSENTT